MMTSVWTRAVAKEAEVQTTGFVDDSAVRSKRGKTRRQAVDDLRNSNKRSSSAPRPLCWLEAR